MAVTLWSNVQVAVESAAVASQTVSGITKANPGVITYVGTDPSTGDFIRLTAQGMTQVDGRVFKLGTVDTGANTAPLSGENTTGYSTFTSGGMEVLTFGTTLTVATGLSASGGEANFIDVTTIHDTVAKQVPGVASAATYNFTCLWDAADAGLVALKARSEAQSLTAFKFTFANGAIVVFNGYCSATLLPTGSAQDKVETSVTVTMFGKPTIYSS